MQKPISVDVVEGQAMLAAARKYGRVVQVGTQRRSTPHLIEARERSVKEGKLGKVGLVEIYLLRRGRAVPMTSRTAAAGRTGLRNVDRTGADAAVQPGSAPRGWRAFMEYGNGHVGDMGIHMFDMTRWLLDLGWPKRISSSGGILVNKEGRISRTRRPPLRLRRPEGGLAAPRLGDRAGPEIPVGGDVLRRKGTLKASVLSYDFTPVGQESQAIHKDVTYELDNTRRTRRSRGWRSTSRRRFADT